MVTKLNLAIAGTLVTSPVWLEWLGYFSTVAQAIAAGCGAIVGLVTLYRMLRKR